jgi:hypothetical protein
MSVRQRRQRGEYGEYGYDDEWGYGENGEGAA